MAACFNFLSKAVPEIHLVAWILSNKNSGQQLIVEAATGHCHDPGNSFVKNRHTV